MVTVWKRAEALFFLLWCFFSSAGTRRFFLFIIALLIFPPQSLAGSDEVPVVVPGTAAIRADTLILTRGLRDYPLAENYLIPGTVRVVRADLVMREEEDYEVLYPQGLLRLAFEPTGIETLKVYYQSYPLKIPAPYRSSIFLTVGERQTDALRPRPEERRSNSFIPSKPYRSPLLSISGAKGLTVGRGGGGFSMDQSLDLSVNGMLSGGTRVELQLSDQSIPVASGGGSLELRELDQVSFRVSNGPASAVLGDYDYSIDSFEFARVDKKLEGIQGGWIGENLSVSGAGAISPGKFTSYDFQGVEGKQGPYQLRIGGTAVTEGFVVMANTERVYLDGVLMKRGEGEDYTIDYNSGTVTFTSRQLISSDSRIEVDFEYSERGKRGTFYATTFRSRPEGLPLGIRGYFLRESDEADTTLSGQSQAGGRKNERMGLAYDYQTDFGLRVEGEGAFQSGRFDDSEVAERTRSSGAFWLKGAFDGFSLFDTVKKRDRWKISWYEKGVQNGFLYPGRRYSPDFRWKWGLSPKAQGREEWRVLDVGFGLADEVDISMELGRIRREYGEQVLRRKVQGAWTRRDGGPTITGEFFTIGGLREEDGLPDSGPLQRIAVKGRSLTFRQRWSGWTPSVGYTFREERSEGSAGWGESFNEIVPSLEGRFSGNIKTHWTFRLRDDRIFEPDGSDWRDEARMYQGRADVEYGEGSGLRVRGSAEYRQKNFRSGHGADVTTVLGRGELLTLGWDRFYSTSTIYELTSTSNVIQRAVFEPERENEGDYLEDGTFVGPGNGTHVRSTVAEGEGEGQVLGAALTSIQNLDFSSWLAGRDWSLVSLTHTSTLSVQHERVGDDRWRVYLFFPAESNEGMSNLFRSLRYRGELEGAWGEESEWNTVFELEYLNFLDKRYTEMDQNFSEWAARFEVGGPIGNGFDMTVDMQTKRRLHESSLNGSTDLHEKRVESEVGYAVRHQLRYYLSLDVGSKKDLVGGARLRDASFGPGINVFFGGGGNLDAQYELQKVWNETPNVALPLVMSAGRDVGATHRYRFRANWRLRGALDLAASLTGRRRPGRSYFENTGRTEFTYRF